MTTQQQVHKFLTVKLDFEQVKASSHDQYRLRDPSDRVTLPTYPVIPRHRGDLSNAVLKKTAAAMGLSASSLQVGCTCGLSADCIWLCLTAHLIATGLRVVDNDPIAHSHKPVQLEASASAVLDRARGCPQKWNSNERQALEAAMQKLIKPFFVKYSDRMPAMGRWLEMAKLSDGGLGGQEV